VDTSLLLSLGDRSPGRAAPSVMRPDAWRLGERLDAWARGRGLVLGDPDTSPLGRARCERLAARVFASADPARVELFARWLTWTFALDDTLDQASVAGSGNAVHAVYEDLLRAIRRGHASPGARPLESTVAELWSATAPLMSRTWRRRFVCHLEEHRDGCAARAVHRRTGRMPDPVSYPALRRRAAGPFLFDLIEPVVGVELPRRVLALPAWQGLVADTADLITWSNDIASYPREETQGDLFNLVIVVSAAFGLGAAEARDMVAGRIAVRSGEVRAGAPGLERTIRRLDLTDQEVAAARRVLRVLLDAPGAHIDWLAESGRYSPSGATAAPLDGLASLR
jgi:hypothetical protein